MINMTKDLDVELALREVRAVTFEELAKEGYDVQVIEDNSLTFDLQNGSLDIPEDWKFLQKVVIPKVATLQSATLFMDGTVFFPDRNDRNKTLYFNGSSFNPDTQYINYLRHRDKFVKHAAQRITPHRFNDSMAVSGRCFSTRVNHPNNFGHFIHDTLSRIYYEDLGVIAPGRVKLIPPRMSFPIQKILFEKIFEGYEIVWTPDNTALEFEELMVPVNLCGSSQCNQVGLSALANRMRQIMQPYAGSENYKVCVSRRDGTSINQGRNFVNLEAYETRMLELGFRVVEASKLAPEDQFRLWANTTDIVGVQGSGMMNMIMMPPGNYFEIHGFPVDKREGRKFFAQLLTLRCAIAAKHHRVMGIPSAYSPDGPHASVIDIEHLERILT